MNHQVTKFKPYPFHLGQKIRIEGSHREGDWEVIGFTETKIILRCPVSKKEVTWDKFCYLVEKSVDQWPLD